MGLKQAPNIHFDICRNKEGKIVKVTPTQFLYRRPYSSSDDWNYYIPYVKDENNTVPERKLSIYQNSKSKNCRRRL